MSRADLCLCNLGKTGDNDSAAEQEDGGHHDAGTKKLVLVTEPYTPYQLQPLAGMYG